MRILYNNLFNFTLNAFVRKTFNFLHNDVLMHNNANNEFQPITRQGQRPD